MTEVVLMVSPLAPVPFELLHAPHPIDTRTALEQRGEGAYARAAFEVDGQPGGVVHFLVNSHATPNDKASAVLVWLTGVWMRFHGPVAFTGLDPTLTNALVRDLG